MVPRVWWQEPWFGRSQIYLHTKQSNLPSFIDRLSNEWKLLKIIIVLKGKEEGDNLIKEKLHNWTSLEDKWLAYKKHLVQVIT